MGARKYLSADGLISVIRRDLREMKPLTTARRQTYSWADCVLSGLAIFGFKMPSLLHFEKALADEPMIRRNLRTLYGVKSAPSDTQLRERLDVVDPKQLRKHFKKIFSYLQRGKALESYRYLSGHYIISVDGTGQFSSKSIHCDNCCEKHHRNGEITYYHHMLGAVLVHPDHKPVIPLAPEPIMKNDGATKNDCERNAAKRLLTDLRREHPHLKVLIVEDSLASNYPHLSLLDSLNMDYVIGIKPGDHKYLFDWIANMSPEVYCQTDEKQVSHEYRVYKNVALNDAHYDYRVTVIDYYEKKANGKKQHFSWVTKLDVCEGNVYQIMRAARSRWRVENETFNTLKNQGYHFEHNFGHGYKNLCSVMSMLMMLAFLIDQVQQLCCQIFQKARVHCGPFQVLFERVRVLITMSVFETWANLLKFIGDPLARPPPSTKGGIAYQG